MLFGGEARCLPRLRDEVEHHDAACGGGHQRLVQLRDQHVRQHAGEPRTGAEQHQIGVRHRPDGLRAGRGSLSTVRVQTDLFHTSGRTRDGHLPPDRADRVGIGVQPDDVGGHVQRHRRHRQHPALHAEQPARPVQHLDRIAQHFEQPGQHEVAHGMSGEGAAAAEAVLEHRRPQLTVGVGVGERGERLAQVAGRQHAQFAAQPAGRPAVVGHRHHRRHLGGDPAKRRQRRL